MKKTRICLCIILSLALVLGITKFVSSGVKDQRIIGTWESPYGYGTFVFNANGKAEIFSSTNIRSYEADDGYLRISYGKFGDEVYKYEITYDENADGEQVECLALYDLSSGLVGRYVKKK